MPLHGSSSGESQTATDPVRTEMLPYGAQWIEDDDIAAVVEVLKSSWLTTGPKVDELEYEFAKAVEADYAVAVTNGTAALHAAVYALGIGPGDEVIVPSITFVASANCVAYQGATPVFADVVAESLLVDPEQIENMITAKTKAVVAVDFAGQPCDYDAICGIAKRHGLYVLADACHAIGGAYKGKPVGSLADLNTFSFHPVKHITTGEGGMITTADPDFAGRMRTFRNHGIDTDHRQRAKSNTFAYEMTDLGYNYRLSDIQCALGISQLRKLMPWVKRRQEIATRYDEAFAKMPAVRPLTNADDVSNAYHLYVIRLDLRLLNVSRDVIFEDLRAEGIGVNVHYAPVHTQPYYREHFGTGPGQCPVAEAVYQEILSLPMFPKMSNSDVDDVVRAVDKVLALRSESKS